MPILISTDAQYLQNVVFSFEKGSDGPWPTKYTAVYVTFEGQN